MPRSQRRSKAYPAIELRASVGELRRIVAALGVGTYERARLAIALGYSGANSGAAGRKIGALVHFGLLERGRGTYRPSELGKSLAAEPEEPAPELLEAAFLQPTLYRELVRKYRPQGRVPFMLGDVLARDHGITEVAKDEAARVFLDSGQYARIMAPDGVFLGRQIRVAEPATALEGGSSVASLPEQVRDSGSETPREGQQSLRLALTHRKLAELRLPASLNERDLEILAAAVKLLEVQVRANEPAPTLRFRPPKGS